MKKIKFCLAFLSLSLTLSACSVPGVTDTPEAKAILKKVLDPKSYSKNFASLFKNFTQSRSKTSEGKSVAPQALGNGETASNETTVETPAEGSGESEPGTEPLDSVNPETELGEESSIGEGTDEPAVENPAPEDSVQSDNAELNFTLQAMQAQRDASKTMRESLEGITPPSEFETDHNLLLEYFQLSEDLSIAAITEINEQGEALFTAPGSFEQALEAKYAEQSTRLESIEPRAYRAMVEVQVLFFREQRLQVQSGEMLDADTYKQTVLSLFPNVGSTDLGSFFPDDLKGSENPSPEEVQSIITQGQQDMDARFEQLASLHPPEECEKIHTIIYAMASQQKDVTIKLLQGLLQQIQSQGALDLSDQAMLNLIQAQDLVPDLFALDTFGSVADEIRTKLGVPDSSALEFEEEF